MRSKRILLLLLLFIALALTGLRAIVHSNPPFYVQRVDLKELGNFNFDGNTGLTSDIPARFRELDGKRVQLEGFMWSPDSGSGLKDFQFVYNVQTPNYRGPPLVQERVFVHVPAPQTALYVDDWVSAIGVLHVSAKQEVGTITAVYTFDLEYMKRVDDDKPLFGPPPRIDRESFVPRSFYFLLAHAFTIDMLMEIAWWLVGAAILVFIALWLWRYRSLKTRLPNTCPKCGYDVRATPDQCPECGLERLSLVNERWTS